MTWTYKVSERAFYLNGEFKFRATYAGAEGYKDDVNSECMVNRGPLPRGKYRIVGQPFTHPNAGPFTLRLEPYAGNNMCGRAGFRFMVTVSEIREMPPTGVSLLHQTSEGKYGTAWIRS